jgi:hypothetical protein
MKTDGATFKRYMEDNSPGVWPNETYYDDSLILVNGEDKGHDFDLATVADTDVIEIKYGVVFMEGDIEKDVAMTTHFRRWLRKQTTVRLLVEVPKEYEAGMRNAIKYHSGTVIS